MRAHAPEKLSKLQALPLSPRVPVGPDVRDCPRVSSRELALIKVLHAGNTKVPGSADRATSQHHHVGTFLDERLVLELLSGIRNGGLSIDQRTRGFVAMS